MPKRAATTPNPHFSPEVLQLAPVGSTVYVGLSGGVDSSVSAALLKGAGYRVVGVFIKIWQPEFIECTWRKDRLDAMRVAAALSIPFKEIDLSDAYKKAVIDTMLHEYAAGRTPNPDVLCNRHIKFGMFKDWALKDGADFVATGHYAQISLSADGTRVLMRGHDTNKDQSYFLWQLTKDDLDHALFPVGHLTKPQVREIAARYELPVAKKPDSQGLCFVGDIDMHTFLQRYITTTKGNVLSPDGEVIGEHDGALLYTRGQRHGFYATGSHEHFVIGTNVQNNTITVSENAADGKRLSSKFANANWMQPPIGPLAAQVRYRGEALPCTIEGDIVVFETPVLISPGQSLVVYKGAICIGGALLCE